MFDSLIDKAQDTASRAARKTAIGLGAGLCLCVGLAFLTFAAWLFLVTVTTAMNAALIIGGVYSGVGLILIGTLSQKSDASHQSHDTQQQAAPAQDENMGPKIVEAFMNGLQAGRRARS